MCVCVCVAVRVWLCVCLCVVGKKNWVSLEWGAVNGRVEFGDAYAGHAVSTKEKKNGVVAPAAGADRKIKNKKNKQKKRSSLFLLADLMRVQKCAQREANLLFFFVSRNFGGSFFFSRFLFFFSVDGKIRDEPSSALNKTTNWLNVGRQKKNSKKSNAVPSAGWRRVNIYRTTISFRDLFSRHDSETKTRRTFFVCFFCLFFFVCNENFGRVVKLGAWTLGGHFVFCCPFFWKILSESGNVFCKT